MGGTVYHHAIEKGHIGVLESMLSLGIDVYSGIEIADNAGRTPLFEAIENLNDQDNDMTPRLQMLTIILKNKALGGFGANPNVIDYNGHTPIFLATRNGMKRVV